MKRLQGGSGIGALVWVRTAVLVGAACLAAHASLAQSVRLVPSTSRFAGAVTGTLPSDQGVATTVPLNAPAYLASDVSGNIYIADTGNDCIRRVDTNGNMTVVVGQPTGSGDTCLSASTVTTTDPATGLFNPSGVALDAAGDLFIADTGHNCVRRLPAGSTGIANLQPLLGSTCTEPAATAVAPSPSGLVVDAAGNLYIGVNSSVAPATYQVIRTSLPNYTTACLVSGTPSTAVGTQCGGIAGGVVLNAPQGVALDVVGNLYIADSGNACVREVTAAGAAITAAGKCTNDGTSSNGTILQKPVSVAADAAGHLYINDNGTGQVYELASNQLELIAGDAGNTPYATSQDGLAAVSASLLNPQGLAADKAGNVYVADTNNNIVRILAQGLSFPETSTGNHSQPQNLWFIITNAVTLTTAPSGDFPISGLNSCNGAISAPGPGVVKTCQVVLHFLPTLPGQRTAPLTMTDSSVSPAKVYRFGLNGIGQSAEAIFVPGTIKTLAASLAQPSAIAIDSAGDVYYAESGTGAISVLPAGSGTPTSLIPAGGLIKTPTALALDAAGNLYIADSTANSIFTYDANGNLSTLVSGLDTPVALAVDELNDLYVAEDGATPGVLEIYAGGQQSIIAGQGTKTPNGVLATTAKFVHPSALYLDPAGDLYVADRGGHRVYVIDPAGIINFFAGNGTATDGSPTNRNGIGLVSVSGLSADPAGDIYITDGGSNRLFVAYAGQAQNPEVTLLAGDGTAGNIGDNGPANAAELNNPMAVAVDGAADVFIADTGNSALREITYKEPTLDFGTVKVGQTGGPLGTTLWNAGNGALTPLTMGLDDPVNFAVDTIGCGGSLADGSTCNLSFFFTPQSPGSFVGHEILSDNAVTTAQTITLIANAPPPPQAAIAAPPVTVVYGNAYTLAATITGNQATAPTGTATFSIAGATLCAAQGLPANGAVSCTPSPTLENVGTYTVAVAYSGDSTYPALTSNIILKVTPRPVTITADNKTRPINTANPPLTGTVVNTIPGQSITATYSTTATIASPAGSYPDHPCVSHGAGRSSFELHHHRGEWNTHRNFERRWIASRRRRNATTATPSSRRRWRSSSCRQQFHAYCDTARAGD